MLTPARQRGVTLIELLIALAIAGVLAVLGLPAVSSMMAGARTKGTAESIMSGLRLARSEAIKRNVPMRFQFVSTLDNTCAESLTSPLWVVAQSQYDALNTTPAPGNAVTGACGATVFVPKDQPGDECNAANDAKWSIHPATNPACASDPFIAAKGPLIVHPTVVVASDSTAVTFGPLGQELINMGDTGGISVINISSTVADTTPWRILVSPNGAFRLCNAGSGIAAGNPLKCP